MHLNLSCPAVSHLFQRDKTEGSMTCVTVAGVRKRAYSQLEAEGNTQHLEALHLKVNTDRCFVVLIKNILTKPRRRIKTVTRSKVLTEETRSLLKEGSNQATFNCWMLPRQTRSLWRWLCCSEGYTGRQHSSTFLTQSVCTHPSERCLSCS